MYRNNYIKERNYREYDSLISIRLNSQFYKFLYKLNPKNISATIRSLIRVDLYGGNIEITDKDITKMFVCFYENERQQIKEYTYRDKKNKFINVRIYEDEKKIIIERSNGNISSYVDLVIMDFINSINDKYFENRWDRYENYIPISN